MHRDNWDDLRFVLAVAETGTVSAAARRLGVNHATVLRRVAAFEDRQGMRIFDRTAQGYAVRPDRIRMIEAAREVESAVFTVERLAKGAEASIFGDVRITSTDTFCHVVLPPLLMPVQSRARDLRLSLLCSNDHLDLSRLHADIAVRPAQRLPDGLVGAVVARLGFAAYAAPGAPDGWLGLTGAPARSKAGRWLSEQADGGAVAVADSFLVLREFAASGVGRAVLPCVLGDVDPRLSRLEGVMPPIEVDLWVASHADLADVPRIAAVREVLSEALSGQAAALRGQL